MIDVIGCHPSLNKNLHMHSFDRNGYPSYHPDVSWWAARSIEYGGGFDELCLAGATVSGAEAAQRFVETSGCRLSNSE